VDRYGEAMNIQACLFDVFGTVVDWRTSVSSDLAEFAQQKGISGIDWSELAVEWRKLYQPSLEEVRSGRRGWTILDVLHREGLVKLIGRYGIQGLSEADIDHLNRTWHRLRPWPDVVEGLTRLKRKLIIAPCSNGNIALMVNLAKRADLPWDCILGAETARAYKPMPEAYLASCRHLGLPPTQVMMVAAHNSDLEAAKAQGLATAFVPRLTEHGPGQTTDLAADPAHVHLVAEDFIDLAVKLGC
jgi:2-haloacid dehalogenase